MSLLHPFDKIISRVTGITTDKNFIIWSKSDLINFIDEGQQEYCEKTKTLRAESSLTTRENSQIYNLPEDCFIVDRIEREDGCTIEKTSSRDLERMFGRRFREASGTPQFYYQDLDGQKQLRFYPNPSEDLRASFATMDSEFGGIISSEDEDEVAETYDSELGEVVDTDDENLDSFDSEQGVVIGVINTADKLRVFYSRYPQLEELEINDIQALSYYCLHKCYEKDSPFQDLQKSQYYETKFQERVNEEATRVYSAYHANLSVRGSYV